MRKAVRSFIILFVIVSLFIVPSMALAAAPAAAAAASGASFLGISTPILIIGGVLLGAVIIYVTADLLTTETTTVRH